MGEDGIGEKEETGRLEVNGGLGRRVKCRRGGEVGRREEGEERR
jgi:hypothetical protein